MYDVSTKRCSWPSPTGSGRDGSARVDAAGLVSLVRVVPWRLSFDILGPVPSWWFRPRAWFVIGCAATGLLGLSLFWFLRYQGLDRADKWSSVVFGSIGGFGVIAGALTWLWRLGNATAGDRREASLASLGCSQRDQWTAEQAARRVRDPWPLNVRTRSG